jgi:ribose-phosphate pyrophosphokinase
MPDTLKLFCGNSNPELAQEIARKLKIKLGAVRIHKYANENIEVQILENVRGADVFVLQTASPPVNEGIMELLIMIHAVRHASAARVTAVIPYYPYVRSDKKDKPRISIAARLVADLLEAAGADRVLTMNLHALQTQGFFRIPVDQLDAAPLLCEYFRKKNLRNFVVLAVDAGRAKWAAGYARRLHLPLAILDKRRDSKDESAVVENVIGDVKGKHVAIFDDEILTAGSLIAAVETMYKFSAGDVYASCVHGVLEGPAMERIRASKLKELVITNTLPLPPSKQDPRVKVLSVAGLFAEAIKRIHRGESVSAIFE